MNRRGQAIMEAVLVLAVVVGVGTIVSHTFKENELIAKMVSAPWLKLSGMIQNGVWLTPKAGAKLHPNSFGRAVSLRGDRPE